MIYSNFIWYNNLIVLFPFLLLIFPLIFFEKTTKMPKYKMIAY
jgi:hypothetical protein